MLLRRSLPVVALLGAAACAPDVPYSAPPASVAFAEFDSVNSVIPLPNDLALQAAAALPAGAQKDLLQAFVAKGGFPNDQEVAITIPFATQNIDATTGALTTVAADLDVGSINASNLVIIKAPGTVVSYRAPIQADYTAGATYGTLTLHNATAASGGNIWDAGATYIVAVRGGPNGVKLKSGQQVNPRAPFFLLLQGKDLSDPANLSIIPGTQADRIAIGAQLEPLRLAYPSPFAAVDALAFDHHELAVLSTFKIAPVAGPQIATDPGRGAIPLPSDFMLDASGAHVQNISAFGPLAAGIATLDGFSTTGMALSTLDHGATIVGSTVNHNTALLYEIDTSTTPPTAKRVKEYGEGIGASPGFQAEPPQIQRSLAPSGATSACTSPSTQLCVSTAIGLQPAIPVAYPGATSSSPPTPYGLPPLKDNTEYAVILTDGIKALDLSAPPTFQGKGLTRSTLASILLAPPEHPVSIGGKSQLAGVDDATAAGLENMRNALSLVIGTASATISGFSRDHVAMGYTFRTQSISGKGNAIDVAAGKPAAQQRPPGMLQFAALPYNPANSFAISQLATLTGLKTWTPAEAWTRWGMDATIPNTDIEEILEANTNTVDGLDPVTGAFSPARLSDPVTNNSITPIKVLIAVPHPAAVTQACPAGVPNGVKCAPLVIFHHGLGGARANMLNLANELTKAGFVVAAIDSAKHGDRAWCATAAAVNGCGPTGAGTCTKIPNSENQGDTAAGGGPPGICAAGPVKVPTNCASQACLNAWLGYAQAHAGDVDGNALISGQYFVSGNFFRTRDTIRQDLIDQSFLVLALARPPAPLLPALAGTNAVSTALLSLGGGTTPMIINPASVHWIGQSLGAILGANSLAANPRFADGVLNVGGGTLTDILANAPSFASSVCALLQGVGIYDNTCHVAAGKDAAYLQFLILAKWVLDPADPINAAGYVSKSPLPNLLGTGLQPAKPTLGQMALCDRTVPNAFNFNLFGNTGVKSITGLPFTSTFVNPTATGAACVAPGLDADTRPFGVPHGFITSLGNSASYNLSNFTATFTTDAAVYSLAMKAQDQAAQFFNDGATPTAYQVTP
ncbi:MAG: hypothetical protein JST92_11615 [Deltaproteobacteria bacterium]|nr:hypothetical protein [Deltaproteobacteria bacterium]